MTTQQENNSHTGRLCSKYLMGMGDLRHAIRQCQIALSDNNFASFERYSKRINKLKEAVEIQKQELIKHGIDPEHIR